MPSPWACSTRTGAPARWARSSGVRAGGVRHPDRLRSATTRGPTPPRGCPPPRCGRCRCPRSAYRSPMVPDWPKRSTPSGTTGAPNAAPRNPSVCDAPSSTVTIGRRRVAAGNSVPTGGAATRRIPSRTRAQPSTGELRREPVGGGDHDEARGDLLADQLPDRLDRLGHDRADRDHGDPGRVRGEGDTGSRPRPPRARAAGSRRRAPGGATRRRRGAPGRAPPATGRRRASSAAGSVREPGRAAVDAAARPPPAGTTPPPGRMPAPRRAARAARCPARA